jgi:putative ABC transport system substrate-binding protein
MNTRREVITLLGGAAAWPVVARGQERVRRIGMLTGIGDTTLMQARYAAFSKAMAQFGWIDGRNIYCDYRWGAGNADSIRKYAEELVALAPDVILATGGPSIERLIQASRTVPIVFTIATDPVGSGFVKSLSRPGRNATGFMQFEYSLSGKWIELLKESAPNIKRAAVLWDPSIPGGIGQFAVIQAVAPSLAIEVIPVDTRDLAEMEHELAALAGSGEVGLVVTASALTAFHVDLIIRLAARHKLPAIYSQRDFVANGGLISYAADLVEQYTRAAAYVDRILKGEKPADLPVQAPTRYLLTINLKTAKELGLVVPPSLLARADEVIE